MLMSLHITVNEEFGRVFEISNMLQWPRWEGGRAAAGTVEVRPLC